MSRHHRSIGHSAKANKIRPIIAARLPARCVECPHLVTPRQRFQVAHLYDAMDGGDTTIRNTGPAHSYCPQCRRKCNQSSGGKRGAAVVNARRRAVKAGTSREFPSW